MPLPADTGAARQRFSHRVGGVGGADRWQNSPMRTPTRSRARSLTLGAASAALALALVGCGSDDDGGDAASTSESASPSQDASSEPTDEPTDDATDGPSEGASAGPTVQPPAEPEGECADGDVLVEPEVFRPAEGNKVLIGLDVTTRETPACTWDVSADSLTMSITSGDDDIWSTRQCPAAVPVREAVVRSTKPTRVVVEWSGRRADDECSEGTDWALPGFYNVESAALAGEPASVQFQLRAPAPPTITRSPEPSEEPSPDAGDRPSNEPAPGTRDGTRDNGGRRAAPSPSGAVEPDGR